MKPIRNLSSFAVSPTSVPRHDLKARVEELCPIDRAVYDHLYRAAIGTPQKRGPWWSERERACREALGFARVWRGYLPAVWNHINT